MKNIVWSKDNCFYCMMAKDTLTSRNIEFEERNVSSGVWTKEQLREAVPTFKTFPQIFLDDSYIGGYDNLVEHFSKEQ